MKISKKRASSADRAEAGLPVVEVSGHWAKVFSGRSRITLEEALPAYLMARRWFQGKARQIKNASFAEIVPMGDSTDACLTQVRVEYTEEDPELYTMPLAFACGERADLLCEASDSAILARASVRQTDLEQSGVIYDAVLDKNFCVAIVDMIARRRHLRGVSGDFIASYMRMLRQGLGARVTNLAVSSIRAEQTNSSIVFGDRYILKLFRKLENGINPDLELGRFLTQHAQFPYVPPLAGSIEYRNRKGETAVVGVLHRFKTNEGDAWQHTLDALSHYLERAVTCQADLSTLELPRKPFVHLLDDPSVPLARLDLIGPYYEAVKLLGQRTAELHLALASDTEHPDYSPEPFTVLYQRSLYQSMRNHSGQMFLLLKKSLKSLPTRIGEDALKILDSRTEAISRFRKILSAKISAYRTRIHGDFHLGQVLYTGKDYFIIDFEGEPARPLTERRIKRSPLRDVAGMLRSFHYAAYTSLFGHLGGAIRTEDLAALEPWARLWNVWISSAYLASYLHHAASGGFLPTKAEHTKIVLEIYLLEKALYELGYELNNRPDWLHIPLAGIRQLLEAEGAVR